MTQKVISAKKISKKEARQMIYDRLVVALAEFKTGIKDKKFENNLKKTSRLFADDMVKAAGKDKTPKKAKKKIEKKIEEPANK